MLSPQMQELIAAFPLGFVATVRADGTPAVSPKGTFLVLDDHTIAYGDIRSPGTRSNLISYPATEVNFIDPFRRIAVRAAGTATVHAKGSGWFSAHHSKWQDSFGVLSERITHLIVIDLKKALWIKTPPYDDGATEAEMIATYQAKYAKIYP